MLTYKITEGDYRGEALHAEIMGALHSAFVLPAMAGTEAQS